NLAIYSRYRRRADRVNLFFKLKSASHWNDSAKSILPAAKSDFINKIKKSPHCGDFRLIKTTKTN
ncbi:hypothetical protein, partial [Shewanella hafniensis]|uniref:hypothetical protein n=1 Tax=Shewanella hafniensis TaxID=365590 RepID=UPI001C804AAC